MVPGRRGIRRTEDKRSGSRDGERGSRGDQKLRKNRLAELACRVIRRLAVGLFAGLVGWVSCRLGNTAIQQYGDCEDGRPGTSKK